MCSQVYHAPNVDMGVAMSKLIDRQLPQPPANVDQQGYLRTLVNAVSSFIKDVVNLQNGGKQSILHLDVLENEPAEPFDGMLVYADGTSWNPGSGEGFYGYEAGAWVKL